MGFCRCLGSCCAELGALTFALVNLGLSLLDVTIGACLMVGALSGLWREFISGIVVTTYSIYLIVFIAGVNCSGVMRQPGRFLLSMSLWTCSLSLIFEFGLVASLAYFGKPKCVHLTHLDRHAPTGSTIYWLLGNAWMLAILACRHVLHFITTLFLRNIRDSIINRRERDVSSNLETQDLSERLIQREIRREEREDMRAHFSHKYFGGRNSSGEPTPSPTERQNSQRNNLPHFLLSSHRENLNSPSDIPTAGENWAV